MARTARVLATIGASFEDFALVARREQELRGELAGRSEVVVDVPSLESDIADLTGLAAVADRLYPSG